MDSVSQLPPLQVLYVPDFLTEEEEQAVLAAINAAPASRWQQAGQRRMQNWGGRPGEAAIREVGYPASVRLTGYCLYFVKPSA